MSEFIDIGPECFAAADGSVLSWRGRNYVPQAEAAGRDSSRDGLIVTAIMPTLEEEHVDTPHDVDKMLEFAWAIIANAMNVSTFDAKEEVVVFEPVPGWNAAAARWRDEMYHPWLDTKLAANREDDRSAKLHDPYLNSDPSDREVDTLLGFDVNDFRSRVVYAIFNDPEGDDMKALPEALKPQLLDVPLMEDESPRRIRDHARLMNEDRARHAPERSRVVVKTQTLLRTPWVIVAEADDAR